MTLVGPVSLSNRQILRPGSGDYRHTVTSALAASEWSERAGANATGAGPEVPQGACSAFGPAFASERHSRSRSKRWWAASRKPPSVRTGIRLSARDRPTLLVVCRATSTSRACTGEGSPFHPFSSIGGPVRPRYPRWVSSLPSRVASPVRGRRPRTQARRCSRRDAPHRSGGGVSFLFHSRRSPVPGLCPVACPAGGGTFLVCVRANGHAATVAGHSLPVWR